MSATPLIKRALYWAVALIMILLLVAAIITPLIRVSSNVGKTADGFNLRQIGQSVLIYAQYHGDSLPTDSNVWVYAGSLADDGGLDVPRMWLSRVDPGSDSIDAFPESILIPGPSKPHLINPAFLKLKPCVAVALGKLNTNMPATTPVAWTRGLQPDGTWSADSPYGTSGGYIVFLDCHVAFFKSLNQGKGELVCFDGKGTTSNILAALPPGSRIGEYEPTPQEKTEWSRINRERVSAEKRKRYAPLIFITLLSLPFLTISIYRFSKKRSGAFAVLLWPLVLLILLFVIMPGCW
jgi:hypothetical protein